MEIFKKKLFIWDFHDTLETGTLKIITEIANSLLREKGGGIYDKRNREFSKLFMENIF